MNSIHVTGILAADAVNVGTPQVPVYAFTMANTEVIYDMKHQEVGKRTTWFECLWPDPTRKFMKEFEVLKHRALIFVEGLVYAGEVKRKGSITVEVIKYRYLRPNVGGEFKEFQGADFG